jgi:formylglycine-generating enzyme required for sulfatase activity
MKIKIEFEVPQWTKWLSAGIAVGVVLSAGIARVSAGTVSVKTNWANGDTLTAADLNANFANLKAAVDQLKQPDCPEGYARDASVTAFALCRRGVDEIVKVGTGATVFWIDRHEASVWQNADGTGQQYGLSSAGEYPSTFPENGQYSTPLYALSVAGVKPSAYLTWFQADAACEASGKRLPTGPEWMRAARGTQDPGAHAGTGGYCVTNAAGPRNTGLGALCVSRWGAQDMIGNLWEWTTDWYAGVGTTGPMNTWPGSAYNGDVTHNITSAAVDGSTGAFQTGLPSAALRGGDYGALTGAGIFSLVLNNAPSGGSAVIGLRCVVRH